MKNVIITYKKLGETPLECLERIREINNISKEIPMTYAGRLDPLAKGLLIILVGDECKRREDYLILDKEYIVEILLGIQTDSYDVLGLITNINGIHEEKIDFSKYICKFNQEYPAYSSKVISMKSIIKDIPKKQVEIFSIGILGQRSIESGELYKEALKRIDSVKGDFRQIEIKEKWKNFYNENQDIEFKILKIKVVCSSGTYMRSLANEVGGLAFSIERTRVGKYVI